MIATTLLSLLLSVSANAQPHVLVAANAKLHEQPDGDNEFSRLAKGVDLDTQLHRVYSAQFVERAEGWVRLRTSYIRSGCTQGLNRHGPVGLEVYVKADQLVKATKKKLEYTENGVAVTALPGVPARENVDATITLAVKGFRATANFPTSSIGEKFVPQESVERFFVGTHGANGTFGNDMAQIEVTNAGALPDGNGWKVQQRCIMASGPLVEGPEPVAGGLEGPGGGSGKRIPNRIPLEEGTVLQWPDGVYAGTLTRPYKLPLHEVQGVDGMKCGTVLKGLDVCIDDPDVEGRVPLRHVALQLTPETSPQPKHPKGDVKGETGKCKVEVDVDKKGATVRADARMCAEPFEKAVETAVANWTWKPHMVDGKPVHARTWTWVTVD